MVCSLALSWLREKTAKKKCPPSVSQKGKTVGLLICLVELMKQGIFAGVFIKKHWYWSRLVPGDVIDLHFNSKQVEECNTISGVLDEEKYFIWRIKELDYVMKIMASGGALILDDNCKEVTRKWSE